MRRTARPRPARCRVLRRPACESPRRRRPAARRSRARRASPAGDAESLRATGSSARRAFRRSPSPDDATPAAGRRPRADSVRCGTRRARRAPIRRRFAQRPCEADGIRPPRARLPRSSPRPACRPGRSTAASGPAPSRSRVPARRGRRVRAATDASTRVRVSWQNEPWGETGSSLEFATVASNPGRKPVRQRREATSATMPAHDAGRRAMRRAAATTPARRARRARRADRTRTSRRAPPR